MITLKIRDESTTGKTLQSTQVQLSAESLSVEELIRSYVFQHVKDSNVSRGASTPRSPIVPLTEDEIAMNGIKPTQPEPLDWQAEFATAKAAFRKRTLLVFVDKRQMKTLETVVAMNASTEVTFLRLTMLMGG